MTAVAKLLPCPFCGEPGEFAGCEQDGHYVRCSGRGCYGEVGENYDGCAMPSHMFSSQEDAAAAWNRRAALSPAELGGVEAVAWMRRDVTYRKFDGFTGEPTGRREDERIITDRRVYETDIPLYTTPRAAEAVSEEMVERYIEAYHYALADTDSEITAVRAGLAAALIQGE